MNSATAAALYTFCAHYHSGQFSRGYRLLCAAARAWKRRTGIGPRLDYWEMIINKTPRADTPRGNQIRDTYNHLAAHYADQV